MENIKPYLCSREENREKIQAGINRLTRTELYHIIPVTTANSVVCRVSDLFCRKNYDDVGTVYLYDELDPVCVADCLMKTKKYEEEYELIYCLVCHTLMKRIHEFYKELKTYRDSGKVIFHYGKQFECLGWEKQYMAMIQARIQSPIKRFRSSAEGLHRRHCKG